jgi:peptidoglycan/xylan/chitin deacetylase (PgdA/CDA1 family)
MLPIFMTVDTEGDNLWEWDETKPITCQNAGYIPPFQELCEKYEIPPVYLINYEMIMSDEFVSYVKEKVKGNLCEVGMHLHAWNSPPLVSLEKKYDGNPYIIEYTKKEIYDKHKLLRDLITQKLGVPPVIYRSGRWATNNELFDVLEELGFLVDCSVTPGIYHKAPGATVASANNYRKVSKFPYKLREHLWEVPMTTDLKHNLKGESVRRKAINMIRGEQRWLRPALHSAIEMEKLIDDVVGCGAPYLMFMIHSSELMPGGSPYCTTEEMVSEYLTKLEEVFKKAISIGKGYKIEEYYHNKLYLE